MKIILFIIIFISFCHSIVGIDELEQNYDSCIENTNNLIRNLYNSSVICPDIKNKNKLNDMTSTSIYKCFDQSSGILKEYWLVELDDCYVIRYDYKPMNFVVYNPYYGILYIVAIMPFVGYIFYLKMIKK